MIKVLVVDDSGFMRMVLRKMLREHQDIEVIAEAANGREALKLAAEHEPDLITMDVEMPGLDGLETTRLLMERNPTPIIMVSALTKDAADTTIDALAAGAVDFVPKSSAAIELDVIAIQKALQEKIVYWAKHKKDCRRPQEDERAEVTPLAGVRRPSERREVDLIIIGASTGGPRMLPELLRAMGKAPCPVVAAVHMPELYCKSFVEHLRDNTGLDVRLGSHMMPLEPGQVVIPCGGTDSTIQRALSNEYRLKVGPKTDTPLHPSIDVLLASAARNARAPVGVIMTGMGQDGLEGAREMARRDFPVLTQSKETCVVYGMPKAVVDAGLSSQALSVEGLARTLSSWARRKRPANDNVSEGPRIARAAVE